MRAIYAVIPEERTVRLETEDLDPSQLGPQEVLVEAEATIVSAGTELANYTALSPGVRVPGSWNAYPWRPGYGLVGRVAAAGVGTRFAAGQRVLCFGKHASLQRYDVSGRTPVAAAFPLEETIAAGDALLARMGLIGLAGLQLTRFQMGDWVAVFGLGLVGNLAAQLFQGAGARVMGLDPLASRCERARAAGIGQVSSVPSGEQACAIQDWTGGKGVQLAIDAVGHSAVIRTCVEVCAPHGQVLLLGSPRAPHETDVTPMLRAIHHRWITLQGALEWRLPPEPVPGDERSIGGNLRQLLALIQTGGLSGTGLVTDRIAPAGLGEAYEALLTAPYEHLGVLLDWTSVPPGG